MPKTEWYWRLAVALFEDHPELGPLIKPVINDPKATASARGPWNTKIKNRLKAYVIYACDCVVLLTVPADRMKDIVQDFLDEMKQTGEGLRIEDIDTSLNTKLSNRWGA
jgi:hypothetical protein